MATPIVMLGWEGIEVLFVAILWLLSGHPNHHYYYGNYANMPEQQEFLHRLGIIFTQEMTSSFLANARPSMTTSYWLEYPTHIV